MADPWAPPEGWRDRRYERRGSLAEELPRIKRNLWWLLPLALWLVFVLVLFVLLFDALVEGFLLFVNDPT